VVEELKLAIAIISPLIGIFGAVFVTKAKVGDLSAQVSMIDHEVRGPRGVTDRLARLESDQTSHAGRLDETVRRLESVTHQLQALMLDLAKGKQ